MITTVGTSPLSQISSSGLTPPNAVAADVGLPDASALTVGGAVVAQISPGASQVASLFETANQYVVAEHIEPFTGYATGQFNQGAYLDVQKYNNYVFAKAADTIVKSSADSGITLKKDDVINQLKSANSSIANLDNNVSYSNTKLGEASVLVDLTQTDRDNLTDIYISAKENGIDTSAVQGLAVEIGVTNRMQRMGVVYYSDHGSEISDDATADASFSKEKADLVSGLYGKFGLSNFLINSLAAADPSSTDGRASLLEFLQRLLK